MTTCTGTALDLRRRSPSLDSPVRRPAAPARASASGFPAPLRVALFSGNYDCVRDGANQALNRLVAHLLLQAGADVRIYSPTGAKPAFVSVGEVRSVPSLPIPGRSEYRLALGLTRGVRRDLERFRPDVVHLSAPDLLGRQAQGWARRRGISVVASLHTRFETYLDYYRLSMLRGAIERYLDRFYLASDRVLVPNAGMAEELAPRYGAARVAVWGRGVDRTLFHPSLRSEALRRRLGYAPGHVVPLFFGRLVKEKGLGIFAGTIDRIRAQGLAVRPLIIGEGPEGGWLAERLPEARFLGHLSGRELGAAVASADLLVNPSVTEAFGNVNLEAMASGLAIVSADVTSASALIAHGRTGLLVGDVSAGAFARAALALIRDGDLRRRLGVAASAAADDFSWEACLSGVVDEYRALLDPIG